MTSEASKTLRKLSRQRMHGIWEIAKTGHIDTLTGDDKRIAEVMLEHQEQYFNQFVIVQPQSHEDTKL